MLVECSLDARKEITPLAESGLPEEKFGLYPMLITVRINGITFNPPIGSTQPNEFLPTA
jgi:hypothetical protein